VTLGRRQVRELLETHGLAPSRALGQNFVADANTVRRIAALAEVGPGDRVVEVGAGLGSLTLALADTGAAVTAIELDRHLVPILREQVEPRGVRVVQGDARPGAGDIDWDALLDGAGWALVANLPYNIATSLVLDLLAEVPAIQRMLVMVQREVGERLAAPVGHEAYGIPSVKAAWWAEVRVVGRVPATVFVPQPRVESVLVRLVRHSSPPAGADVDRAALFRLVDAGFGQRRKMLRRSLAGRVDAEAFVAAGVAPDARAEQLTLSDWAALVRAASSRVER
jgi:16S rRNA (adenine1518-N6/adenine1519-N6)-dimethyltransferase